MVRGSFPPTRNAALKDLGFPLVMRICLGGCFVLDLSAPVTQKEFVAVLKTTPDDFIFLTQLAAWRPADPAAVAIQP